MDFIRNFPFFSIMLCMFAAIMSSVINGKTARNVTRFVLLAVICLSAVLLFRTNATNESFVFMMGHFPAPWGNEIRAGQLEALMALFISTIAFLSVNGGMQAVFKDVEEDKINLYFILVDLIVASILAMIYTNDLFTAYVFIEINTIAGCGLIMVRQVGKSIVTAIRYMVVSLLGSGLFLIGVTLLYTVTGHLLMSNIQETVKGFGDSGEHEVALTVIVGLMSIGLAIKSGLYPFHLWIPDAYGYSNVTSSSLLSSIVSKGYIFLLIKIYYRVIGIDYIIKTGVNNILFIFGIIGIIMGSVLAIREKNLRKVIAYSSVAQIGYIYMGIGMGTVAGTAAALFHILAHGATKSLLFLSSSEFTDGSHSKSIYELYGLGHRHPVSALAFGVGAFSMVGFPFLAGFISKLQFGNAAIGLGPKMYISLFALAVSTVLNSVYFLRIVVILYSEKKKSEVFTEQYLEGSIVGKNSKLIYFSVLALLVIINIYLGSFSKQIMNIISTGLSVFN